MKQLRYTLISDGPSDRALIAVIDWLLGQNQQLTDVTILPQFADPRESPTHKLTAEKLLDAIERFPCEILVIHRDAERETREKRQQEIFDALSDASEQFPDMTLPISVIPVRMTEAWLLIDEQSIRRAADNPNGSIHLNLPRVSHLESLADPKETLNTLLIQASEKTGRRLDKFKRISELAWRRGRVANLIGDYSALRSLNAFQDFEADMNHAIGQLF